MSPSSILEDGLVNEVKDLQSAEAQLIKAIPKLASGPAGEEAKEGTDAHLAETKIEGGV